MVRGQWFTRTGRSFMGNGIMIMLMVMEYLFIQTETSMKETGIMIKHMDLEYIRIMIRINTKESGMVTRCTDKAKKHGLTDHAMKDLIIMARNKD